MYGKQTSRSPLLARRAIGLGLFLLGAIPAFAQDGRWCTNDQVKRGTAVFAQGCAECHGANAEATPDWRETTPDGKYPPPPLNGTAHAWHHPLDMLRRQINMGGVPLGGVMPPFKHKLSPEDIDTAIAFFQSKWNDEIYGLWMERNGDDDSFFRKVGGYTIEGHVPAQDIKRLLAERPEARGLTVPGMPKGSPGMEHPQPDHYQVLLLGEDGSTAVFAEH